MNIKLKSSGSNQSLAIIALLFSTFCLMDHLLQIGVLKNWAILGGAALLLIPVFLKEDMKLSWILAISAVTASFSLAPIVPYLGGKKEFILAAATGLLMIFMSIILAVVWWKEIRTREA